MIGNDIVDYSFDEKKYLNQRYVSRCLSELESEYLYKSINKNAFFWSLWACKEAAYKSVQKCDLKCIFSPTKFQLSESSLMALCVHNMKRDFTGEIIFSSKEMTVQITWPADNVVHCLVAKSQGLIDATHVGLELNHAAQDNQSQSKLIRVMAKSLLMRLSIDATIERPNLDMGSYAKPGPPILIDNITKLKRSESISLSHDKQWLAFAICE